MSNSSESKPLPKDDESARATGGTTAANVALVRDAMTRRFEKVHSCSALTDAARKMRDLDVGVLPVYDGEQLLGMLSDRDIVVRAVASGKDPRDMRVEDVYTRGIRSCRENEPLVHALERMGHLEIRRLVVLDEDSRPTGILSLGDAAPADAAESHVAAALAPPNE